MLHEGSVHAIVGREAELEAVERFLDEVPSGPLALLIEGEAGIGKTALWLEAVRVADDRAYRVLQVRPAQSEAELSYVGPADLLGEAFDSTRASLPAPQERAPCSGTVDAAVEAVEQTVQKAKSWLERLFGR